MIVLSRFLLALAGAFAMSMAAAQTWFVENPDGSVASTIDGQPVIIPAVAAVAVTAALRDNRGDFPGLSEAIQALIAKFTDEGGNADLAIALTAFAVYNAQGHSLTVDAIVRGAVAGGDGKVSASLLLNALSAGSIVKRMDANGGQRLSQVPATAENPSQISPVE